jgi:hypothetical protein
VRRLSIQIQKSSPRVAKKEKRPRPEKYKIPQNQPVKNKILFFLGKWFFTGPKKTKKSKISLWLWALLKID